MGSNSVVAAWTQQAVIRSGFTPDVIVDNLPAATHRGEDAQLTAAITTLQALLAKDPRSVPSPPPYPKLAPPR
jgi:tricorn protease